MGVRFDLYLLFGFLIRWPHCNHSDHITESNLDSTVPIICKHVAHWFYRFTISRSLIKYYDATLQMMSFLSFAGQSSLLFSNNSIINFIAVIKVFYWKGTEKKTELIAPHKRLINQNFKQKITLSCNIKILYKFGDLVVRGTHFILDSTKHGSNMKFSLVAVAVAFLCATVSFFLHLL